MSLALVSVAIKRAISVAIRADVSQYHNSIPVRIMPLSYLIDVRRLCVQSDAIVDCWKCGQKNPNSPLFCSNCNTLQKPKREYNFFQLFGIQKKFDVDSRYLAKKFRELQTQLHPDKFSNASEDEKNYSADLSAVVNTAYRTLADPLERGLYLLAMHGVQISESSNVTDKIFLLQVMELNEELESLKTKEDVSRFGIKNKETLDTLVQEVAHAFQRQDIDAAKDALSRMKYFSTIQDKFKNKSLDLDLRKIE